jgi:transposase
MNKILKVTLSKEEKEALICLKQKRSSNIGMRALFILLSDQGHTVPRIAKQTGYSAQRIRIWLKRYQKTGIKGLYSISPPGRPPLKSKAVKSQLDNLLAYSPSEYGYQEGHWTTALFVDYFSKKGLLVSRKTVERALHDQGWRYKRLSKVPPKDKPDNTLKKNELTK